VTDEFPPSADMLVLLAVAGAGLACLAMLRRSSNRFAQGALALALLAFASSHFVAGPRDLDSELQEVLRGVDLALALSALVLGVLAWIRRVPPEEFVDPRLRRVRRARPRTTRSGADASPGTRSAGLVAITAAAAVLIASFALHGIGDVVTPGVPRHSVSRSRNLDLTLPDGRWRAGAWIGPDLAISSLDNDVTILMFFERPGIELGVDAAATATAAREGLAGSSETYSFDRMRRQTIHGIEGIRFHAELQNWSSDPSLPWDQGERLEVAVWTGARNGFTYQVFAVHYAGHSTAVETTLDAVLAGLRPLDQDAIAHTVDARDVRAFESVAGGYRLDRLDDRWTTAPALANRHPTADFVATHEGSVTLTVHAFDLVDPTTPPERVLDAVLPMLFLSSGIESTEVRPRPDGIEFFCTTDSAIGQRTPRGMVLTRGASAYVVVADRAADRRDLEPVCTRALDAFTAMPEARIPAAERQDDERARRRQALFLRNLGMLDRAQGDLASARSHLERSLTLADDDFTVGELAKALVAVDDTFAAMKLLQEHPRLLERDGELRAELLHLLDERDRRPR
jgi:hypothetical protein